MARAASSRSSSGSLKHAGNSTSSSGVSAARLHQKAGTTFGGYPKVARGDGMFTMKKSGT